MPSTGRVREDSWHNASSRRFFGDRPAAANQGPFESEKPGNRPMGGEFSLWKAFPLPLGKGACLLLL